MFTVGNLIQWGYQPVSADGRLALAQLTYDSMNQPGKKLHAKEQKEEKREKLDVKVKEDVPKFKDVTKLNELMERAGKSTGSLYRHLDMLKTGQIPVTLVVETLVSTVDDFNALKDELAEFRREGLNAMDDIADHYDEIMDLCSLITKFAYGDEAAETIIRKLEEIIDKCQSFISLVNDRCKQLQKLRVKTARAWLAATSVAGFTVGAAASALTILSGGAALPVLAPLFAFGAGTTAVATASHVAFSPTLGAQIKDMDAQIKELDALKVQVKVVNRKAEVRKQTAEATVAVPHKKAHHWSFW
eukprot:jgi/Mesen1/9440/ME000062S08916